ncbi:Zn-ribbon domain-containing OB-fold protein [Streptacidiphilus cavernicola]|uniref:Zn-ribbon domain-containing OB-fold protein n=1 Tax=Streptacidiphilus cavernicola TaxID=3342716 RepID=A0ABV6VX01_9ACTN
MPSAPDLSPTAADSAAVDPAADPDSAADPAAVFRDGLAHGELRYQRCRWCATRSAQLSLLCATCGGSDFSWERSSGQGRIHHLPAPTSAGQVERTAVVELDEGFRMSAQLAAVPAHRLWPGAAVRLEVADENGALRPMFRPYAA